MAKKGGPEYAATEDTATLEHPDSKRDQRAIIQTAPASIAFKEVQTPSAHVLDSEDGGTVRAFAKTRTNENDSEVTEVECPDGHAAGKGEATSGTVGKTATCGDCGKLLIPTTLINNDTGEEVQFVKKGGRRLVKSTRKTARGEAGGRVGGKGVEVNPETGAGMEKGTARKTTRRKTAARKSARKTARKASKSTKAAKSETAAV